jgi:hypothetical protein
MSWATFHKLDPTVQLPSPVAMTKIVMRCQ